MESIQNSAVDSEEVPSELKHPKSKAVHRQGPSAEALQANLDHEEAYFKYTREPNALHQFLNNGSVPKLSFRGQELNSRGRRALSSSLNSRTTCTLSIQTDPLLWRHIADQVNYKPAWPIRMPHSRYSVL